MCAKPLAPPPLKTNPILGLLTLSFFTSCEKDFGEKKNAAKKTNTNTPQETPFSDLEKNPFDQIFEIYSWDERINIFNWFCKSRQIFWL